MIKYLWIKDGYVRDCSDRNPKGLHHPSLYEGYDIVASDAGSIGDAFVEENVHSRPQFALEGDSFDFEALKWRVDKVAELESVKQNKITAIDAKTAELIQHGFEFENAIFSMSDNAQKNWNALATGLALKKLPFPYPISTKDEAIFILTSEAHLNSFLDAYLLYQADPSKPLGSGRTLKARVTAAATLEELEAIVDDRE
jgi:hypothetical protein